MPWTVIVRSVNRGWVFLGWLRSFPELKTVRGCVSALWFAWGVHHTLRSGHGVFVTTPIHSGLSADKSGTNRVTRSQSRRTNAGSM